METALAAGAVVLSVFCWLAFSYAFVSFIEWQLHRHLMHRKRLPRWVYRWSPYILETFEAHAVRHHGTYYDEFDHEPDPEGREYNLDIKLGETLVMFGCLVPVFALLIWISPLGGVVVMAVSVLHNRAWNVLHRQMHIPVESPLQRWSWFRYLARHHFLHHEQSNKNYNVVFPLFDHIFGTVAQPTTGDVREMLRLGYVSPRRKGTAARVDKQRRQVELRRGRSGQEPFAGREQAARPGLEAQSAGRRA